MAFVEADVRADSAVRTAATALIERFFCQPRAERISDLSASLSKSDRKEFRASLRDVALAAIAAIEAHSDAVVITEFVVNRGIEALELLINSIDPSVIDLTGRPNVASFSRLLSDHEYLFEARLRSWEVSGAASRALTSSLLAKRIS